MKIAIAGASGFLGRPLVAYLRAIGHECVALSRHPARGVGRGIIPAVALDALPACDAIVNLAGESVVGLWTPAKRREILASRVAVTRQLIAQARAQARPPRVFVSASAVGYYGDRPGEVLDEDAVADPTSRFRAQVCQAWEDAAEGAREFGARVTRLRIGNVMSPDGGYLGGLLPLYRRGAAFVLGNAEAKLSWISREDAVRLMAFALESSALEGAVNVVAPSAITQRTLTTTLVHRLGGKVRGRLPAGLLRFMLGEFSRAILDDQDVVPARAISAGFHFFHPAWRSCVDAMCEAPGLLSPER